MLLHDSIASNSKLPSPKFHYECLGYNIHSCIKTISHKILHDQDWGEGEVGEGEDMYHGHYIMKFNQKQLQHSKECNAERNSQVTPSP
jgi:hypothetical protein